MCTFRCYRELLVAEEVGKGGGPVGSTSILEKSESLGLELGLILSCSKVWLVSCWGRRGIPSPNELLLPPDP